MNSSASILIIDDEPNLRHLYTKLLSLEGYDVESASTGEEGLRILDKKHFALIITDIKLPDINGLQIIKNIKDFYQDTEVIAITAYGNIPDGVTAIKSGAFDYITKGDIDEDEFILRVKKAVEKASLKDQIKKLREQVESRFGFANIIGRSKPLLDSIILAKKVAATESTVLLTGETGTGKELFAQAIHNAGTRKDKTLVAINCSAIPKDLQESELFGYVKGAFTGAVKDKKGLFEEADHSSIFLDEVGDMSMDTQAKLLRVLETKTISKLGDTKTKEIDIRIISATNKDLPSEIEKGNFRSDLYYRLNGFTIRLPSLNERTEDIKILTDEFIRSYSVKSKKPIPDVSPEFMDKLINYKWKGNIRELKNIIERAIILSETDILTPDFLPQEFFDDKMKPPASNPGTLTLEQLEKEYILKILNESNQNKTLTAKKLGIGTVTLYRKLKEYGAE
ncbi:MAG: sigma-54 dependent transcriptional regulator [bacterium]